MSERRLIGGLIAVVFLIANPGAANESSDAYLRNVVTPRRPEETVLGFSPTELAGMYTRAIERGTPVKYAPFINTLNQQMPNVRGRYELTEVADRPHPGDLQYAYYFYPLQAFHHELTNQHGYRTVPNFKYDSVPAKSSKKDMNAMNPLLVGISSFMGMALFFLLSLFFYPRFMHFMHFPFFNTSRTIFQNELTNLTAFVTEAIDYYNKNMRKGSKRSSL
ncbi:PREDICTED: uncharacterized protein LOC105365140 [Ceratosolen solmsi marchali]|uniref:Uncharacterized protein LOC105365140 n=1 Tax=Ceratosolen solmsi marchali TaxID=326594 RepID=A0AAJ6YNX4_9HYME|nr:PREDICTED: uncharacterized protein LOC105365140 [Ceratosolen solmsi marchali]